MANYRQFGKWHRRVYEATDGRVGAWLGRPMVLMHTIGAKSGQRRSVVLQHYPIVDDGTLVIASNNGQRKPPDWWFNLTAHPEFDIQVGREKRKVCAEPVNGEEREALWQQIRKINKAVDTYQRNAEREIPVIHLRTLSTTR